MGVGDNDMETQHTLLIVGGRSQLTSTRPEWTVKEYAHIEGVTERTVWSWISKGAVSIRRTPGGRVRILPR